MMGLGAISFAQPWVLLGLLGLPVLWFLLRLVPPLAKEQSFPAIMLLGGKNNDDPPAEAMPPWLLILRMTALMLLILGLAGPTLGPRDTMANNRPLLLVIDNGWQAAHDWADRRAQARDILRATGGRNINIYLLATASPDQASGPLIGPMDLNAAQDALLSLEPQPWSPDHAAAKATIDGLRGTGPYNTVWIWDGLEQNTAESNTRALHDSLTRTGMLRVYKAAPSSRPIALLPIDYDGTDILLSVAAPPRREDQNLNVIAIGPGGRQLGSANILLPANTTNATAALGLPLEMRNQIRRLYIAGQRSAGASLLLDQRNVHPRTGIFASEIASETPPLRSARFYLSRALDPYASVIHGNVGELLDAAPAVMVLANLGRQDEVSEDRMYRYIEDGGLLIRFAGDNMSTDPGPLVPVRLRAGGRDIGGSLTWDEPQKIGEFPEGSPFFGLATPDDVIVSRQVLAAPSVDLRERTWAQLADGTPLVTAQPIGAGWLVLFHTSADTDWSDLPLSGLFVDMLRRLLTLAKIGGDIANDTASGDESGRLSLRSAMNGYGELVPVSGEQQSYDIATFTRATAGADTPPGIYAGIHASGRQQLALNLANPRGPITRHYQFHESDFSPANLTQGFGQASARDLGPLLLASGLVLLILDMLAAIYLKGIVRLDIGRRIWPFAGVFLLALPVTAVAQIDDNYAIEATSQTRLAYVATGNAARDQMIHNGLSRLGLALQARTSVTLDQPIAVDPGTDPLALYSLIYWPITHDAAPLDAAGQAALSNYLLSGGMVLFDSGIDEDATGVMGLSSPEAGTALQTLLGPLGLPPLARIDSSHVLSKSYYLLDYFPGRLAGRAVWADAASFGGEGSVSPVIIGAHDWAAAWASYGASARQTPGFQANAWQNEYAMRFGINVVMYALTGTYKADQLHMDTIIDRLKE